MPQRHLHHLFFVDDLLQNKRKLRPKFYLIYFRNSFDSDHSDRSQRNVSTRFKIMISMIESALSFAVL